MMDRQRWQKARIALRRLVVLLSEKTKPAREFLASHPLHLPIAIFFFFFIAFSTLASLFGIKVADIGAFGDSFGMVTCLFSGLAFAAAWHLVGQQKIEMAAVRKQLDDQGKSALTNVLLADWSKAIADTVEHRKKFQNMEAAGEHFVFPSLKRFFLLRDDVNIELLIKLVNCDIRHNPLVTEAIVKYHALVLHSARNPQRQLGQEWAEVLKLFNIKYIKDGNIKGEGGLDFDPDWSNLSN